MGESMPPETVFPVGGTVIGADDAEGLCARSERLEERRERAIDVLESGGVRSQCVARGAPAWQVEVVRLVNRRDVHEEEEAAFARCAREDAQGERNLVLRRRG